MDQFLITNKKIISFEEFHYSFSFGKIDHSGSISGDKIILQCKGMPFLIYLYQTESDFALSNNQECLASYLKEKGITLTKNESLPFQDVYIRQYKEIILCADWEKITIDQAKGSLSIEKTDWQYHKTPIASPQAYQLIHEWFYEWLDLLQRDNLLFDLTAGLDSKISLSFISRRKNWDSVFYRCNPYKFNMQNREEHKELDGKVVPLSEKFRVLKELGDYGIDGLGETFAHMCSEKFRPIMDNPFDIRIRGTFASQLLSKSDSYSTFNNENDFQYLAAFLGGKLSDKKRSNYNFAIPHIDNKLLRLAPGKTNMLISTIVILLYCDFRFLKFPIKSFSSEPTYTIFKLPLKEACKIIESWKEKGLLNEEESKGFEKTMKSIEALKKEICS